MGGSSAFEVAALFAVAAVVCWPSVRRALPAFGARSSDRDAEAGRTRFAPRPTSRRGRDSDDWPIRSNGAAFDDFEDDLEAPRPVGRSSRGHRDDGSASARPLPAWQDDEEDTGVLPLAEALLRGERKGAEPPRAPGVPSAVPAAAEAPEPAISEPFKVLLVDSRDKFRTTMLLRLARTGHRVFPVARPREALDVFSRERSDLILIHRDALREVGSDFVRRVRSSASHVPILVHGTQGPPAPGSDLETLARNHEVTVVTGAGDETDIIADMVDCSLAASRVIRRVRDDQQVRGQLLSELCYNLRSSLDVISGYTDILSDEPDLSRYRDLLERMRVSTAAATVHMQSCVDVALDVPDTARQERVDLSTLSQKIERLVSRQIGGHPLRLTTSGPMQGSALFTDGEKLLAILSHVVTDAIKFTPSGEINISVRSLPDRTDFVVTDAGPGISADAPMPFAAALPPGGGDKAADSGVGLTIAERLSRSIGATLTGRCADGGAASFTISVPAKLMTQNGNGSAQTLH